MTRSAAQFSLYSHWLILYSVFNKTLDKFAFLGLVLVISDFCQSLSPSLTRCSSPFYGDWLFPIQTSALYCQDCCCVQTCAGRPIPVLPQHTFPGNVILSTRATSGLSPPVDLDPELEKLCLAHITAAARNAFAALASKLESGWIVVVGMSTT